MDQKLVELQQQVRNNSDELQDFLRDLGSWTKQMEIKDEQLTKKKTSSSKSSKPEPPRSVDELKRKPAVENDSTEKKCKFLEPSVKKATSDYDAWSKYDVEKALTEIENSPPNEVKEVELSPEMKLQKAVMQKDKGNEHFKKGNFSEAIESYTTAMQCDPQNAILPANRAMAYLKVKEWGKAEADSSLSISIDNTYVKAYHRRATARKKLGNYAKALEDFKKVLDLEPNNKLAQAEIEEVNFLKARSNERVSMIADKGKTESKLCNQNVKDNLKNAFNRGSQEAPITGQVFPINKPPHKRSNAPLHKIEITEVNDEDEIVIAPSFATPIQSAIKKPVIEVVNEETNTPDPLYQEKKSEEMTHTKSQGMTRKVETEINSATNQITPETTQMSKRFKRPNTAVQFSKTWKCVKDKATYLKKFRTQDYPSIFKHSMDPNIFSEILHVIDNIEPVSPHLLGISRIPRISALIMFLEKNDSQLLHTQITKAKTENVMTAKELQHIENIFGGF